MMPEWRTELKPRESAKPPEGETRAAAAPELPATVPVTSSAEQSPAPLRRPLLGNPLPLLGFFTRLPVGTRAGRDDLVNAFPLVPLVGYATGGAAAVFSLLLGPIIPSLALAGLVLALLVGLTGLNQTDGLLDLGDGLMVHGSPEHRREAMHDRHTGVGAVGLVLLTYLVSFGGLAALTAAVPATDGTGPWFTAASRDLALSLIAAEVLCRVPYLLLAWRGRPSHEGLGAPFLRGFGLRHVLVGLVVAAPVAVTAQWIGWLPPLLALLAVLGVALVLLRTAGRLLGGVGGDVMGASQELARAAAFVALAGGQLLALRLGW
jgi:adenosylcobinamide-GDP ribazoletransferase